MIKLKDTALIVIDMQNDFLSPDSPLYVAGAPVTIPKISKLLARFREVNGNICHIVREYREDGSDIEITRLESFLKGKRYLVSGTPGCEIVQDLKPLQGEYRIVKNRFSAFMNTELDFILRRLKVQHVVICGLQLPNCIRATIFDAISCGYDVTVITDAAASQTDEIAKANILDVKNIGVECVDTRTFLSLAK
jgi:nicotinamidase-related amidase